MLIRNLTIILVVAASSFCYLGIKSALPYTPPLFFAAIRTFVGGAALLLLLPLNHSPIMPERKHWRWIGILALLSSAVGSASMFFAAEMTTVGIASILGNLQTLLTVILAIIFLKESMTLPKVSILTFGVLGIILISFPALGSSSSVQTEGAIFAFGSSAIVATTNIIVKRYLERKELLRIVTWQLILGGTVLFIASFITEQWSNISFNITFVGVIILLGVIGTGILNFAWYTIIQLEDVGKVSMYFFLVPVIGFFSGVAFNKESVEAIQIIGSVIIVVAMIFLSRIKPTPAITNREHLKVK